MGEIKAYEPELGQAAFGQPFQKFPCPDYVEDALEVIRWLLIFRGEDCTPDPFANSGARFECDVFKVHAYSWSDEVVQEYNFTWRDIRVSWYKWMGKGMSINRHTTWDEMREMLRECLQALLDGQDTKV
ncbi:hypothetical protein KKH23_08735 [Patescibacteria group bacterium]|nr:hypothetical protein [Patescibacteria group bacterium]